MMFIYQRVEAWIRNAHPGTIQLTGVLGLAILLIGFYQVRQNRGSGPNAPTNDASQRRDGAAHPTAHGAAAGAGQQHTGQQVAGNSAASSHAATAKLTAAYVPGPSASLQAKAVFTKLQGIRRVTLSVPGVLVAESSTVQLQEAATALPEAVACAREIARMADTYLLAQVSDDIGQAVVLGALEAADLIGTASGQVKPHRILFCSTVEGKNAIVRQLEPELHVDAHGATIDDLKRFVPQLLHVSSGTPSAAAQNIVSYSSLQGFFGL